MAKTTPLGVRLHPEVKAALDKAARDDLRSLSSLIDKILTEWLRKQGYLSVPQQANMPEHSGGTDPEGKATDKSPPAGRSRKSTSKTARPRKEA